MAKCGVCGEDLLADASQCPLCLSVVTDGDDDAYELTVEQADIPAEWQAATVYTLELPVRCPHCRELLRTVRVVKLKRTQVTFTSMMPRGGRVIACPECNRMLSVELATL